MLPSHHLVAHCSRRGYRCHSAVWALEQVTCCTLACECQQFQQCWLLQGQAHKAARVWCQESSEVKFHLLPRPTSLPLEHTRWYSTQCTKPVSWPEWHFQRYPVKVITLNLTCLKIHAPRHSVTIREQQAERQSRRESQSMFQKRLIHISSHDGLIRKYLQRIPLGHTLWWHPIPNINRGAALKNALPSQPWKLIAEFSTSRSTTVVQICGCPGAVLLLIIYEITSIVISSREKTGSNIPRHVKRTWNSNFNVHKLYILRAICGIIAHTATARFRQGQGKLVTRLVALHRKFANSCLNFY